VEEDKGLAIMRRVIMPTTILAFILMVLTTSTLIGAKILAPNYFSTGPSILNLNRNVTTVSNAPKVKKPTAKTDSDIAINAKSYLVLDRETLTPLVSYNSSEKLPLASITKLMTAIVTLENSKLEEIVGVKNNFSQVPENKLGLYVGEKISVENLLYAALIPSANDAAEALAYYVGKGDYNAFIKMMNDKAVEIGMKDTSFSNAVGLDEMSNYSTVSDLAYLANYAIDKEFIANAVILKEKTITDASGVVSYNLKSTNQLLGDPDIQILGLKTGTTPAAGECLVSVEKLNNGQEILTVILGSSDRFGDTKKLVRWIEENVSWR